VRRYAVEFVRHWFYNIIGFGGRVLPAPVAEILVVDMAAHTKSNA